MYDPDFPPEPQPGETVYTSDPDFPAEIESITDLRPSSDLFVIIDRYGSERTVQWHGENSDGTNDWIELGA